MTWIVLLQDTTAENGATQLFPDMHLSSLKGCMNSTRLASKNDSIRLTGERGDVWAFDARCVHRGMPNITDGDRSVFIFSSGNVTPGNNSFE
jgi:ectoine hydroxylase-related dioxygenase (phytanoyl-CoA dioxygenase family)